MITNNTNEMLFTLQRYKFLSKSQPLADVQVYSLDVVYLAKVQISKQITTQRCRSGGQHGCCLPCKGTNF